MTIPKINTHTKLTKGSNNELLGVLFSIFVVRIFITATLRVSVSRMIKGIVQRDLTGIETRLKKSVLLSYSVGKFSF